MTQEDKDLLLKDLCARLPYGIKAEIKYYDGVWELLAIYTNGTTYATRDVGYPIETYFEECKPYLFPMSKVVEEIVTTSNKHIAVNVDFFHKNHIDYRGLIPKGLANDATGLNIY